MKLTTMQPDELRALAPEFAVEVDENMNKAQILARFTEDGITQKMVTEYFKAREKAAEERVAAEAAEEEAQALSAEAAEEERRAANLANVVTTRSVKNESFVEPELTEEEVAEAVIAETSKRSVLNRASKTQVLLVMDRENRSYSVRGYKFTHDHPFVLVDPDDAEYITLEVDGFRYATPKEAREYYS